ncbi:hypothetical protein HDU67_001603 [Dinochytrium kinnereticum]|nr:hypothetical protein HDU67_001603 [Dinochytrium kinnereticum]
MSTLAEHKKSIYLVFSPVCPAYAEVATFLLAKGRNANATDINLNLGLHRDVTANQANLIVPAGSLATARTSFPGKSSIVRYIARQFSSHKGNLYGLLPLDQQAKIDYWMDTIRTVPQNDAAKVQAAVKNVESNLSTFKRASKDLTAAELLVWDFARQHPGKSTSIDKWVSEVEKISELKEAVKLVAHAISSSHILDEYRYAIATQLAKITDLSLDVLLPLLESKIPRDPSGADFVLAVPRLRLPGSPDKAAKELEQKFIIDTKTMAKVEASGIFLKFYVNRNYFRDNLIPRVLTHGKNFGKNSSGYGKIAVVEFSSPNIAKPFHVGHLRSTIIGNFIQKTLNANGWSTVSINYLGDWGKQYGLLAIGFLKFGSEEKLKEDPIRHLYEVYVKINQDDSHDDEARAYFGRMEAGDKEALALWQRFRDMSIEKYTEVYGRVNVEFEVYSGESKYSAVQMRDVVEKLEILGLLTPSDGAKIVDLNQYKLGAAIIEKRDGGGMLYISRDIAAAIDRQKEYKFDNMFYVVGVQQEDHFKKLFKILELMGVPWAERCKHISFGMIKTKDGNMSTRKGTVLFLEDILNNVQESMLEVMKKNEVKYNQIAEPLAVADLVGITAIMIQDMAARRIKDYEFDWDRMLAFEGDTGPYLQYAHARLCSIERNAAPIVASPQTDLSVLTEPPAMALLDMISLYPDVVREVGISLEPCNIVNFSFKLAHAVMVALENLYVLNQPPKISEARLAMYTAARITLGNAMSSLGVVPLERM